MLTHNFDIISENYKIIENKIGEVCVKKGISRNDITFLAATKTVSAECINHAISLGLKNIGENKVQELLSKYDDYNLIDCDLQFIGNLQSNKIKYIADKVSQIQSVHSMSQVKELSKQMQKLNKTMNILIEVNIGNESSKGGVHKDALYEFIDEASEYKGVFVNGLMTIPPILEEKNKNNCFFLEMYKYFVDIGAKNNDNIRMNVLSMGMSDDFSEAIECGANMVRIGSALFGERIYI